MRLPIAVPNPANRMFIRRENASPVDETEALTVSQARQLLVMPSGDSLIAYRDRAILAFYVYTGVRIAEGCGMQVKDIRHRGETTTFTVTRKGGERDTHGLHFKAERAIAAYLEKAGVKSGPLFRVQRHPKVDELGEHGFSTQAMYQLLMGYLRALPSAMRTEKAEDGTEIKVCLYSPHLLRATAATLLREVGVDIQKVQTLLGHKDVKTTMVYDKRRIKVAEGASHEIPV